MWGSVVGFVILRQLVSGTFFWAVARKLLGSGPQAARQQSYRSVFTRSQRA